VFGAPGRNAPLSEWLARCGSRREPRGSLRSTATVRCRESSTAVLARSSHDLNLNSETIPQFVTEHLTAIVASVGWMLTGGGWFVSQRAQRKLFVSQVRNSARGEIVAALRTEQGVMRELHGAVLSLDVAYKYGGLPDRWNEVFEKLQMIVAKSDAQWVFTLEQYEVLFPETAECRRQLVARAKQLNTTVTTLCRLAPRGGPQRSPSESEAFDHGLIRVRCLRMCSCIFQNATLGEVVGRSVPFRQPPDSTVLGIVVDGSRLGGR
jgi:hypothetical protein